MTRSEQLTVDGYDIVALAQARSGGGAPDTQEWIVLNNNSTHFIVCHREPGADTATAYDDFRYGPSDAESEVAYEQALKLMVRQALRH